MRVTPAAGPGSRTAAALAARRRATNAAVHRVHDACPGHNQRRGRRVASAAVSRLQSRPGWIAVARPELPGA